MRLSRVTEIAVWALVIATLAYWAYVRAFPMD